MSTLPLITVYPSADPTAWPYAISAQAAPVFESLPEEFLFDDLVDVGEAKGHSPERVVEYLRTYQELDMATVELTPSP